MTGIEFTSARTCGRFDSGGRGCRTQRDGEREESTMAKQLTCDECKGTGQVGEYEYPTGNVRTDCPWCDATGKVDEAYVVRSHGWNGDWSFSEVEDVVVGTLGAAKRQAERVMKRRFENVLEDGTPTIKWVEVSGPGALWGVEADDAGRFHWSEA